MTVFVNNINQLQPIRDNVLVTEMNFADRVTSGGIFIPSDNGKNHGIRPRWGKIFAVGPEQQDVTVGQWICVEHGRWTRAVRIELPDGEQFIRRIDPKDILLVSDTEPMDDTFSDKGI